MQSRSSTEPEGLTVFEEPDLPRREKAGQKPAPEHDVEGALDRHIPGYGQRFDIQTGLLNYLGIREGLARLLRNRADGRGIALVWIDLMNLRREFSLWGWTGAEAMARRVAGALRSAVDSNALLGRVSGGSFLVAMDASKHDKDRRQKIQAIVDTLTPARSLGSQARSEVAAGVAFFPVDTDSAEELVRFASLAATRAAHAGSRAVIAFHSGMNTLVLRDHMLEVEMRRGLDLGQFTLAYQPKVALATGQILGAEALIRWNHPEWGEVAPAEFLPIAERSELIHRIFEHGLRTALEQMQRWRDIGLLLPIMAVNASAVNVRCDNFAHSVRSILAEFPLGSTELELEMTESLAFEDEELFAARMRQLKAIGVRVAIDDFGTRYTGFNVLKHLPLDAMKIDQCFIRGIDHSPGMRSLCQTIVAMARQLNLRTVAEGIEQLSELEVIREIGCDAGQGYLFQQPAPAEEFAAFFDEWPMRKRGFGFTGAPPMLEVDPLYGAA